MSYAIGVVESRIGGSTFWILPGSGKEDPRCTVAMWGASDTSAGSSMRERVLETDYCGLQDPKKT